MLTIRNSNQLTPQTDIDVLIGKWESYLQILVNADKLAANTAIAYRRGFLKLLEYCNTRHNLEDYQDDAQEIDNEITETVINEWQGYLLKVEKKSPATVNAWLAGVKAFYRWAEMNGFLINPAKYIKGTKQAGTKKRHKRLPLTDDEVLRVLAQPDPETPEGKRARAILYLMAYTGARTVEVHRANLENLRNENGQLVLDVTGKGHTEADDIIVLINPALQKAMLEWLAVRRQMPSSEEYIQKNGNPLFVSFSDRSSGHRLSTRAIRTIVKKYFGFAEIKDALKTTHSLRHTAITKAIGNGAPVQKVQAMARHSNINTTMIYFHEFDRLTSPAEEYVEYGEPKDIQDRF